MYFHSVGKTTDTIDLLKMEQRELTTRSAHSRRSRAEILSTPVALDLQSLDNSLTPLQTLAALAKLSGCQNQPVLSTNHDSSLFLRS